MASEGRGRVSTFKRLLRLAMEIVLLPFMFAAALLGRFSRKRIDVGIGPEPLINNIYHKRALERHGYTAQTYASHVSYITDRFDVRGDRGLARPRLLRTLGLVRLWWITVTRYRCLYLYFNGGVAAHLGRVFLWRWEPRFYRLAGVKLVLMPYGSDIQVMTRSPNLHFKHAMTRDYPAQRLRRCRVAAQVDLWIRHADHTISGCEWVDYMHHWDTLMLAHFSIDVEDWKPAQARRPSVGRPLRILHAPNHRTIKGSEFFIQAVKELCDEGEDVELVILERVPNSEVRRVMSTVDIVADQLVVGWYAMFALEAMAMGLPVLCRIRSDLEELYTFSGLLKLGELPIVKCTPETAKDVIRHLARNRHELESIGKASRAFVVRHHSLEAVGGVFDRINRSLGLLPSRDMEGGS